ncbi:MAG TPA: hypothetical protein VNH82_10795 [Candidatus Dormibacteraeota bacterium]|nr:hypothetical protein [Candidatus Dormibacteraeota bacterium]
MPGRISPDVELCVDCGAEGRILCNDCHDRRTGQITAALTKAYREVDDAQAATQGVRTEVTARRGQVQGAGLLYVLLCIIAVIVIVLLVTGRVTL